MKLWEKGITLDQQVEQFTVGKDRELDVRIAKADILGTLAHAQMLYETGLITALDYKAATRELTDLYGNIDSAFIIEDKFEDIHSKIETILVEKAGPAGKKIHTGRSRNDQVLTALKIYFRDEIKEITKKSELLAELLLSKSEQHKNELLPGYTHLQVAMPSSFGLWFSAYSESLTEDLQLMLAAYRIINSNPLGSAAGYGSSFPLKRKLTTDLLGFETLSINVINAQMGRGKTEKFLAYGIAAIAATLSRFSMDCCLYMSQNFGFIKVPDHFTTGSSIMPHKKNPDVFELIRAKCNRLQSLPNEITIVTTNLASGYHRDYQILKEIIFPSIEVIKECLDIMITIVPQIIPSENILENEAYRHVFSVEEVNRKVLQGIPFRDAYRQVASDIRSGNYNPDKNIYHNHEGSIGNLSLNLIREKLVKVMSEFKFKDYEIKIDELLSNAIKNV